jgi:hypothetical protein
MGSDAVHSSPATMPEGENPRALIAGAAISEGFDGTRTFATYDQIRRGDLNDSGKRTP